MKNSTERVEQRSALGPITTPHNPPDQPGSADRALRAHAKEAWTRSRKDRRATSVTRASEIARADKVLEESDATEREPSIPRHRSGTRRNTTKDVEEPSRRLREKRPAHAAEVVKNVGRGSEPSPPFRSSSGFDRQQNLPEACTYYLVEEAAHGRRRRRQRHRAGGCPGRRDATALVEHSIILRGIPTRARETAVRAA